MKVFAVSGSPREISFTEKMLDSFVKGLGNSVQISKFYPHKMKISYCTGCWTCWTKTKGICCFRDDMDKILPEIESADILIWAFPLYVDGIPSHIKKVLDRMIPLMKGGMYIDKEGHTRHVVRKPKMQKAVLISSCGFPELDNFDSVKNHFKAICKNAHWIPSGEILLSAAGASAMPQISKKLDLIKEAGKMFSKEGKIPKDLEHEVGKEVIDRDLYRVIATANFEGKPFEVIKGLFSAMGSRFRRKKS